VNVADPWGSLWPLSLPAGTTAIPVPVPVPVPAAAAAFFSSALCFTFYFLFSFIHSSIMMNDAAVLLSA